MLRTSRAISVGLLVALMSAIASHAAAGPPQTGDLAHDSGLQWALDRISVHGAWDRATGTDTVIAVVDSGASQGHEDLKGKLIDGVSCRRTGGDADACSGDPADDDGHGSHVAGIAAAATGNGTGISGVAPDAQIMPIKVLFKDCLDCQATGNAGDVAAGIRWAADRGADVINLSLGATTSSVFGPQFAEAIRYAWARGSIPVVAAGNQYVLTADFGDAPAVVVSATDRDDGAPSYSKGVGSARWAVSAPGGEEGDTPETCAAGGRPLGVLSTYWAPGDDAAYACLSGTSMAAPHVAGALAVLVSTGASPDAAVAALLDSADDLGPPGRDELYGSGRIDLAAAVARITTSPLSSPLATSPTTMGSTGPPSTSPPIAEAPDDTTASTTVAPEPEPVHDPTPTDGSFGETSAPQPFVAEDDDVPVVPAGVAGLAIAAVAAAGVVLRRRGFV